MAIRNIREIGDPVLNKSCKVVKEVTDRTRELIEDMFDTMYEAQGVGLAAPQVGILKRIVTIDECLLIFLWHDVQKTPKEKPWVSE